MNILQRIVHILMLQGSFIDNLGLLNGKMGIAIFFFHYARFKRCRIYSSYAGELLDEIYNEIDKQTPLDFQNGLCGLAWGIEYLIQNKFVKANADEVLEDLDVRILERDIRHIKDNTLNTGLKGHAHYVLSRYKNKTEEDKTITYEYINELIRTLSINPNKDLEDIHLSEKLKNIIRNRSFIYDDNLLRNLFNACKYSSDTLFYLDSRPLSIIHDGYAGIALKILYKT